MKRGLARLAVSSGAMLAPSLALAQTVGAGTAIVIEPGLDRDDVAGARIEPLYRSRPILVGPLFAQPSLAVVAGYDSNVFNRPDASGAALTTVMPALELRADLPRHELEASAAGTLRRFSRHTSENSEEFSLRAGGRLDMGARQALRVSVEFAHLIEPRSSAGSAVNAAEPASFDRLTAEAGVRLELGRLRIAPALAYERLEYDPVMLAGAETGAGTIDQSFRDTRTLRGEVRIDYDFSGLLAVFVSGSCEDIDSLSAPASARRDARDCEGLVGLRGRITPVISGEIGVGYRTRDYAQPAFRDFDGVTFRADVQWYVTPLVTLRLEARRAFRNSGNLRAGAILTDAFKLSAYYDPLRNLRLSLEAGLERGDFGDADTRTQRKTARLRGQYRVRRGLSVGVYFDFTRQDVRGTPLVVPFTSFGAGIGLTLTP